MNTQTNKPLTVEEAAEKFLEDYMNSDKILGDDEKFKAGAEWQKGQDKNALTLANQLAAAVHLRGEKIPQLLSGYTNEEVFHKLQQILYNDPNL